jgi:hypothetical protein
MGVLADTFVAYVQPLIDETDGSVEQLNKALVIGQLCYNLALLPEDDRDDLLRKTRQSLEMDDDANFEEFRRSIILPMIRRHQEMFPRLHGLRSMDFSQNAPVPNAALRWARSTAAPRAEAYPGTDRYAPCPCNSGRKYKFCCGKKRP